MDTDEHRNRNSVANCDGCREYLNSDPAYLLGTFSYSDGAGQHTHNVRNVRAAYTDRNTPPADPWHLWR